MSKSAFQFGLRTQVNIPGYEDCRGLIVARGEDMDFGRFYTIAWIDQRGRPATHGCYEAELARANPSAEPVRLRLDVSEIARDLQAKMKKLKPKNPRARSSRAKTIGSRAAARKKRSGRGVRKNKRKK